MEEKELMEEGLEPHKVSEVWVMGQGEPDHWVDVTDHIDTSIKALLKHTSQLNSGKEEDADKRMREWRRSQAEGKGMQYAEAFKRIVIERPQKSEEPDGDEESS